MSLLADIAILRTYSAMKPNGKKETWQEVVARYQQCLMDHTPGFLHDDIRNACNYVRQGIVLPSMRFLQFAGEGIRREHVRGYNCSFVPVDSICTFSEIFYILMCGTGVGYSVEKHHIDQLPKVPAGVAEESCVVLDSKEGWADSIARLIQNPDIRFDYSQVRPAGSALSTGGTASGPESLVKAHGNMRRILQGATGRKLSTLEVHDIVCHIADVVVVGGVRRAALIALFDRNDQEMLTCKSGNWWETNPQRARANNSAVLPHGEVEYDEFSDVIQRTFNSFSGEPGIFWTSDPARSMGTNPCCEIALNPAQFCNLTTINFARIDSIHDFFKAVAAATLLGTIQASFTNFGYLSDRWRKQTEEEALLGVSLTGLAANAANMQRFLQKDIFRHAALLAKDINLYRAKDLDINPAARITTIKPEGTTSTCLDTTSGIHSAHAPYYIRRIRVDKGQEIAQHLSTVLPPMFIEDDKFNPQNYVVSVPFAMPNAVTRQDETATTFLQNVFAMRNQWIEPGHTTGWNKHNVSCTVSYKEEERDLLKRVMWVSRKAYNGIALLPYDGGTYMQAPFEEILEATYQYMKEMLPEVNLYDVQYENIRKDERVQILACSGGQCELT